MTTTWAQEDIDAVDLVARDYAEGWFRGDAARMERGCHDDLVKRVVTDDGQLRLTTKQQLVDSIESGETRNEECEIDIVIDDISDGIATVRCYSCDYVDYLQIARLGEEWKLINVLWRPRRS
jgi:hypothetical protein